MERDRNPLFNTLCAAFCVIVVLSNILSAKMITLPFAHINIPAGLLTYPLTFLLSGLVTEIFGPANARQMVYTALGMSLLSFVLIQFTLALPGDVPQSDGAFRVVLGLGGLRIFSSMAAYLSGHLAEIHVYQWIRRWTGPQHLWLRNNGASCAAQLIDTVIIDMVYLYGALGMEMSQVWPIMLFSYTYKALFSMCCTPLSYCSLFLIRGIPKILQS